MTDRQHRAAITGKFVTAEDAKTNPDTTVSESPCAECERLRGVVHTQGVAIEGANAKISELTGQVSNIRAYCEAFVEESEDSDPEPWNPAAYVLSILDGDDDANSNSKPPIGVGLEPIAFDPPLTDDEAGAFLDAITTDEAEPIVRTVGDLTARHIGKRVRVEGGRDLQLDGITHRRWDVKLDLSDGPRSGWLTCSLDTPCEVLP